MLIIKFVISGENHAMFKYISQSVLVKINFIARSSISVFLDVPLYILYDFSSENLVLVKIILYFMFLCLLTTKMLEREIISQGESPIWSLQYLSYFCYLLRESNLFTVKKRDTNKNKRNQDGRGLQMKNLKCRTEVCSQRE